jgi:ABC-type branched-subunit amino acid transport system ATPase component
MLNTILSVNYGTTIPWRLTRCAEWGVLALIGPNSLSKSTLIRAVMVVLLQGKIRTNGDDFPSLTTLQRLDMLLLFARR